MSEPLPHAPSFRLDSRRALVTGAGRGLGRALAAALAEADATVTLLARSSSEIESSAAAMRARGFDAEAAVLDVSDLDRVKTFFADRPSFDILINNAGTNRPKPMHEVSVADFDAVMNLNLRSAYFVAQGCVKRMLHAGTPGTLIHIGSQMGHVGGRNRSLYCASKWALEGMSKAFALDLARHQIRSNTIAPTFIESAMTSPFLGDEAFRADILSRIKLGRLACVEDVMGAAVFLASDASRLITGTSVLVNGGWTAD